MSSLTRPSSLSTLVQSSPSFSNAALKSAPRSTCSYVRPVKVYARLGASTSDKTWIPRAFGTGLTALALSSVLQLSPLLESTSWASEANILQSPPPQQSHLVDDANVLNRVTKSDLKRLLTQLEEETGYHIDFVTLRKSAGKGDAFEFADQVLENWYPTIEEGTNKAVVLLITSQKEGGFSGGPAITGALGEEVIEAILSENLPVLATDEKYNEAVYSTAKRLVAKLNGQPDIPGPRFDENKRVSNFKTKEETENKRDQFSFVVGGLLVIAFVVPMAQYYAYVAKK